MICVSISQRQQLQGVLDSGATLLELRLDLIRKDPESIFSLLPDGIETVVTCRPEIYDEAERLEMLKTSMDLGATYIDVEIESTEFYLKSLSTHAALRGTKLIVSYHNFVKTPKQGELETLLQSCYKRGGDVAKIAVKVSTMEEVNVLLGLYRIPGKKVILGMGKPGRITRVLAPYLGAEFTFAAPGKGGETAPGQLSYEQLKEMYKVIDKS